MQKIIIADDEIKMCNILRLALTAEGYDVSIVENGEDAMSELLDNNKKYDLLITDVQMPVKSGIELVNEIKEHELDIGIIVITGYGSKSMLIDLMRKGCNDYVDKPFKIDEILESIERVVSERKSNEEKKTNISEQTKLEIKKYNRKFEEVNNQIANASNSFDDIMNFDQTKIPIDVSYKYRPYSGLGGDLLVAGKHNDVTVSIMIADVAGHDISASYHAVLVKALFDEYCKFDLEQETFFYALNDILLKAGKEKMVTGVLMKILQEEKKIKILNAGHWPLILIKGSDRAIETIYSSGDILGVLNEPLYEIKEIDIKAGDRVILYTDGLVSLQRTEGETGNGILLKTEGLCDLSRMYGTLPLNDMVNAIWEDALKFARYSIRDDVMLVGIDCLGE